MAIATENHLTTFVQPQTTDQTFVALPPDPNVPLTQEQLDSVFGGEHRLIALRDLMRQLGRERASFLQNMQEGNHDADKG